MLILARKIQESVVVAENITITILGISGSQVSLGIKAPKETSVHREEVSQRILAAALKPELK